MPRVLVIINPISGLTNSDVLIGKIEDHFKRASWKCAIHQTTGTEILKETVRKLLKSGFDLVAVAGGDGTVAQVASGLAFTNIPIGLIPTGTWNALARNMAIPFDFEAALGILTGAHTIRSLDALEVHENCYLLNVSTGFSSLIIEKTDRKAKRRFGFLAYIWNLILQVLGAQKHGFHLVIDGKHRKVRGAAELMVVNSSLIGLGELPTTLNIHPDDGRVEICILRPRSIFGLLVTAWNILIGGHNRHPEFTYFTANHSILIRSKRQLRVQADGEMIGCTPVDIRLAHAAVKLIVPAKEPHIA